MTLAEQIYQSCLDLPKDKLIEALDFIDFIKIRTTVRTASATEKNRQQSWLGCMNGSGRIVGDIVSPVEDSDVWEVLSE